MNFKKNSFLSLSLVFLTMCLLSGFSKAAGWISYNKNENVIASENKPIVNRTTSPSEILTAEKTFAPNATAAKWEWLFDGKNTDQWISVKSGKFPATGWVIEKGTLVMAGKGGGDIITREKYSNFELEFEFNLTPKANSGLKYFVGNVQSKQTGKTALNGPEYQIIDDYNHPEIKENRNGAGSTAALYLIYEPQNKKLLPAGQWNQARIIAKGKHVEHWLNGVKVVSYEKGTPDFRKRVATTKFKDYDNYGEAESGKILLTDHGDKVYFRNIKIMRL
ncbi:MAG: hypothetical protein JWQ14_579 [Adhaeribacter sp.]|nr:hypothetical protein [Adhaeribacter sp.]